MLKKLTCEKKKNVLGGVNYAFYRPPVGCDAWCVKYCGYCGNISNMFYANVDYR